MVSVLTWSALVLAALAASQVAAVTRISGGYDAEIADLPTVVQVESFGVILWSQICGGHIVTNRYIITGAQCTQGFFQSRRRRIRAGSSIRGSGGVIYSVNRVFNHPLFVGADGDWMGDISLIRLEEFIEYSNVIQRGPIVSADFNIPSNIPVLIAGWGRTAANEQRSRQLQVASVLTTNECYTTTTFCARTDIADACNGDQGGPVYLDNILVGVISGEAACSGPKGWRFCTSVSHFTSWVNETIVDNP